MHVVAAAAPPLKPAAATTADPVFLASFRNACMLGVRQDQVTHAPVRPGAWVVFAAAPACLPGPALIVKPAGENRWCPGHTSYDSRHLLLSISEWYRMRRSCAGGCDLVRGMCASDNCTLFIFLTCNLQ